MLWRGVVRHKLLLRGGGESDNCGAVLDEECHQNGVGC